MPLKILIAAATGALLIVSAQALAGGMQGTKPGQTHISSCVDAVHANHPGLTGPAYKAEYAKCANDRNNYK